MRPNLVFVRAGAKSLHRGLIAGDPKRNWDCCVSWYIDPQEEAIAEDYVTGGDNKFDAFRAYYLADPAHRAYRRYLLLDDDVAFSPGDISRLFDICDEHDLYLCQPSLRHGTNCNHHVTLWNPFCRVRRTRFIEVMVPCFSKAAVDDLLDSFMLSRSTWGIDYAWGSLLRDRSLISVVDAIRVDHTKPVVLEGGAFYVKMRSLGVDPPAEYGRIKRNYPSFGGQRSETGGHILALPFPRLLARPLVHFGEKLKKRLHKIALARAGRI